MDECLFVDLNPAAHKRRKLSFYPRTHASFLRAVSDKLALNRISRLPQEIASVIIRIAIGGPLPLRHHAAEEGVHFVTMKWGCEGQGCVRVMRNWAGTDRMRAAPQITMRSTRRSCSSRSSWPRA